MAAASRSPPSSTRITSWSTSPSRSDGWRRSSPAAAPRRCPGRSKGGSGRSGTRRCAGRALGDRADRGRRRTGRAPQRAPRAPGPEAAGPAGRPGPRHRAGAGEGQQGRPAVPRARRADRPLRRGDRLHGHGTHDRVGWLDQGDHERRGRDAPRRPPGRARGPGSALRRRAAAARLRPHGDGDGGTAPGLTERQAPAARRAPGPPTGQAHRRRCAGRRAGPGEEPAMTPSGRAVMTAIVAVLFSAVVAVGPASASTVGARWQAKIGSRGVNGTATIAIATSGAGTVSVRLKGLVPTATYSETLFRGTCSRLSTRLAALPALRTTARGIFARTNALTVAQATLANNGGAVIRLVSGSHVSCGAFARQAGAAIVTTCDQAHLASALATGGTVQFACDGTITLASTIAVTRPVVLDATDHLVIIDGGGAVGLFSVSGGASFGVVNLTLQDGSSLSHGGAIDASQGGPLTILGSTVAHNRAGAEGAPAAGGPATVT